MRVRRRADQSSTPQIRVILSVINHTQPGCGRTRWCAIGQISVTVDSRFRGNDGHAGTKGGGSSTRPDLELAPIGGLHMYQEPTRRLSDLSQRCHVRKFACLLARPLRLFTARCSYVSVSMSSLMFRRLCCTEPVTGSFIDSSIGISVRIVSRVRPSLTSSKVALPGISMGPSRVIIPKARLGSYSTTSIVPSTTVPERLFRLWMIVPTPMGSSE